MLAGKFREQFPGMRAYYRRSEQSVRGKRGLRVIRARYSHVTTKQPSLDPREIAIKKIVSLKARLFQNTSTLNPNQNHLNKSMCLKILRKRNIIGFNLSLRCYTHELFY